MVLSHSNYISITNIYIYNYIVCIHCIYICNMTIVWSPTSTTDLNSTSQYNPTAYRKLTQTRKTTVSRNMIYTCISMFMLAFWRGYIGIKWIDWNAECIHLFIYKICIHNMYIYTSSRYIYIYILYQYLYLYGFALYIYIYYIIYIVLISSRWFRSCFFHF